MKRLLLSYVIPALAAAPLIFIATGCKSSSGNAATGSSSSVYGDGDSGRLAPFGASTDASVATVNRPVNGGGVDQEMSAAAAALRSMDNVKPLEPDAPLPMPTPEPVEPVVDPTGEVDLAAETEMPVAKAALPTDTVENPAAAVAGEAAESEGFTGMEPVASAEGVKEILQEVDPETGEVIAEYAIGADGIPVDAAGNALDLNGYEVESVTGAADWTQPVLRGDEMIEGAVIPEASEAVETISGGFNDAYAIPGSQVIGPLP